MKTVYPAFIAHIIKCVYYFWTAVHEINLLNINVTDMVTLQIVIKIAVEWRFVLLENCFNFSFLNDSLTFSLDFNFRISFAFEVNLMRKRRHVTNKYITSAFLNEPVSMIF